jgi:hypothetical protein
MAAFCSSAAQKASAASRVTASADRRSDRASWRCRDFGDVGILLEASPETKAFGDVNALGPKPVPPAFSTLQGDSQGLSRQSDALTPSLSRDLAAARAALERARVDVVCAIAFLSRDIGTERERETVRGVIDSLVKTDNAIRAVTAVASAEAKE